EEALTSYQNGFVHLNTRVAVIAGGLVIETLTAEQKKQLLVTKVGKLILNQILPNTFPYINEPTNSNLEIETPKKYFLPKGCDVKANIAEREEISPFKKGILGDIIAEVFKRFKISETSKMLDRLKDLGFKYSTKAGITV